MSAAEGKKTGWSSRTLRRAKGVYTYIYIYIYYRERERERDICEYPHWVLTEHLHSFGLHFCNLTNFGIWVFWNWEFGDLGIWGFWDLGLGDFGIWEVTPNGDIVWKYESEGVSWRAYGYELESTALKYLGL